MGGSLRRLAIVVAGAAIFVLAAQPAAARDESLRGTRISMFGPPVQTLAANEPSFVKHGWGKRVEDWAASSGDEKREFLDDGVWRFELYVNGVQVQLERALHVDKLTADEVLTFGKLHFVQFEANQLAPGTYVFQGRWYGDSDDDDVSELELVRTRTVVFTPNPWIFNPATGHEYRLTPPLSWPAAEQQAVAWGGHLATLNDADEELWLRDQFGRFEYFWIGFNDIATEGSFEWVSGEPVTYTNWCSGEPNNFNDEDAAIINWAHGPGFGDCWNDLSVEAGLRGIVERAVRPGGR